ncbi:MAG TPA: MFS transporter [Steroidobacteraceae bacterium]|nr:MFS transporter [Steroidobacteraceae bacterium]
MAIKRLIGLRWWMISLITIGTILNYLTRATLGVAAPTLTHELGISETEYSWITGVFQIGIMFQPVSGYVMDAIGLKLGFGLFALAWAVIMMLHGAANSWQILAVLRGFMGLAEGSAQPGGMKAVAEWFPAKERGFAGGFYNIGASFGSMLAAPLVAWAILYHSWRLAFVIAGAAAVLWVVVWFKFYHSPKDHPKLSKEERDLIESGQEAHLAASATKPSLLSLLKQRNTWGIAIPRMFADPTWGTLSFWVPFYLMNERGFDLKQIAMFAWLPFVTADVGCLAGPTIAMWLQKRGVGLINARRCAFTVGAVLMLGMMFVGKVDNAYAAIALLCLGGFAHQTLSITVITMSSDLFRKNEVATVAGIAGFCGNLGVLCFTLLIGGLVKAVGYDPFFVALAVFDILGAIWLWAVVRERVDARAEVAT